MWSIVNITMMVTVGLSLSGWNAWINHPGSVYVSISGGFMGKGCRELWRQHPAFLEG